MQGLYQIDPYLLQYRTRVSGSIEEKGRTGIIFEETIFYPEGGGQPSDRGTLVCDAKRTSYEVMHVEQRPEGIVHWIAGEMTPVIGNSVLMTVDPERRRDHMQQHHGQHILSAIFEREYGWDTVGFHMGDVTSTIDLAVGDVNPKILAEVEFTVNRVVMENIPVKTEVYRKEELNPQLLKKLPPEEEEVRLVIIPGIDENACCGTHPRRTGEVGPVKLLKTEKVRGQVRLSFICGERAVQWMQQTADTLQRLEKAIGASGEEALICLDKREVELKKLQKERKELLPLKFKSLAGEMAQQAVAVGPCQLLLRHLPKADMELLRGLAGAYCSETGRLAVLLGGSASPYDVLICRSGQGVSVAANQISTELWPLLEGKGGGSKDLVQGKAQQFSLDQVREAVERLVLSSDKSLSGE